MNAHSLIGKTVINTRAAHQAESLNTLLRAKGANPLNYPCIAIVPPDNTASLDSAIYDLLEERFDWLVVTSANTVFAVAQRLHALGESLAGTSFRVAAIGSATADAVREHLGLDQVDLPDEYIAESLAHTLPIESGARVLLPESAIARQTLADELTLRGASVSVVTAYQTVIGSGGVKIKDYFARSEIDSIIFTSSSTVTYFLKRLDPAYHDAAKALPVGCIGQKTAATASEYGFRVLAVPAEHTIEGVVDALANQFELTASEQK
jgi:uroporphyrinogen-III synthase